MRTKGARHVSIGLAVLASLAVQGCGGRVNRSIVRVFPPASVDATRGIEVAAEESFNFFGYVDNSRVKDVTFAVQGKLRDQNNQITTDAALIGTIDPSSGLYTAPRRIDPNVRIEIVVSSATDTGIQADPLLIRLVYKVEIAVERVDLTLRTTYLFTARVKGDPDNRVTWSVAPLDSAGGDFSDPNSGLYTAPLRLRTGTTAQDTIIATSVVDPSKRDTAIVTIHTGVGSFVIQ